MKAGFTEGKVMDAAETNAIAKLPNREGMLSMFAGALTSTLSGRLLLAGLRRQAGGAAAQWRVTALNTKTETNKNH